MEFTEIEKRMIVGGLESEWGSLAERVREIVRICEAGVRFEGELLEYVIDVFNDYQTFLNIEKKIFESLDDGEDKRKLLEENSRAIYQLNEYKKSANLFEDDE